MPTRCDVSTVIAVVPADWIVSAVAEGLVIVVAVAVVKMPVVAVVAPMVVPLIVPPVIATELAFWVDIVPKPVMSVLGTDATAVKALAPFPFRYPVRVVAPEPPLPTGSVPVTPVVSGRPVTFVRTPEAGVPNAGVMSVGEVARTIPPEPVTF